MPVLLDSSSQNIAQFGSAATSGSLTQNHSVSAQAPAVTALLFAYVQASVDLSAATLAATFGGHSMTMLGSPVLWGTNENALAAFSLPSPPTGVQQWDFTAGGLAANAAGFWVFGDCVSYSGVLGLGSPVFVSGDTAGAQTANSVTVDSVAPAYRVVTGHAVRDPDLFSGYNLAARSMISGAYAYTAYLLSLFGYNFFPYVASAAGGELLVGDAPGAATVTGTATQPSTASWGAIGVPLIPAPVVGTGALSVSTGFAASGALTRIATPSPLRTWVIGGTNS